MRDLILAINKSISLPNCSYLCFLATGLQHGLGCTVELHPLEICITVMTAVL